MKVIVVGGGAAGMMAAIMAARAGNTVTLLEKNEKLGKKVYITGKGRCNLTNACDIESLFSNVISNKKFLYSAFYGFSNEWTIDFFNELGLRTKIERGNRAFPVSDHSSDVIGVLKSELYRLKVDVIYGIKFKEIYFENGKVSGITDIKGKIFYADSVVLALGGKSYESTGSDGAGARIARRLGLNVIDESPSLVPLTVYEDYVQKLQGLSLKNVSLKLVVDGRKKYEELGEMLFTHFGISGPLVLSASCFLDNKDYDKEIKAIIDLKPGLDEKKLDDRIIRDFSKQQNKQFRNSLSNLLVSALVPIIVELSEIDPYKKVNEITREERLRLVDLIKNFELHVSGNRGFNEAIVTKGGVDVKEIDPGTMQVKKYPGLYMVGEMLDLDAYTGGYNLQIAWSTGALCGSSLVK